MLMRYKFVLAALAFFFAGHVLANEPALGSDGSRDDKSVQNQMLTLAELETITVTASKTEQPVFTTPAAIDVLTREEIERNQPFGYQDLFRDVPGTLTVGGPRRIAQEPVIRGFQDEQVVTRVDGARQNFNQAHRGRFFLDPSLLKSIEVLRGSASAIYGSGALGGVISLTTMDPANYLMGQNGLGATLGAGYQSNGDELGLYGTAFADSGVFDVLVSLAQRDADEDLEDGSGNTIAATKDEIQNGLLKFGLNLAAHQRLEFAASAFENTGRNPPNANAPATATNLVDRDTEFSSYRMNYDFEPPTNDWVDFHAVIYRNEADVKEFRLDDGRVDESNFTTQGLDVYNSSRFDFLNGRDGIVTYGIEHYTDEQSGLRNGETRLQFPDAEAEYNALYLQARLPLTERLELVPGLRQDRFEYDANSVFPARDDEQISPRLSLGFQATEDLYFWGGYAEAFRAPSLTELYARGIHFVAPIGPGQVVINEFISTPDLKPEEAETFEAGLRWRTGNNDAGLLLSASAYRTEVDNYVEQFVVFISGAPEFDPRTQTLIFPGFTTNRNVDARLQGFEAALDWWAGNWSGALIATVMEGENTDTGIGLASLPQDNLVVKASRWFNQRSLRAGARVTLAAEQDDVPEGTLITDGWQTLDLFLGWTPDDGWLEGLEIRAGVDNVLGETYRVHPNGINAMGRSVKLSISKSFINF